jgi:hypothetical protein
MIYNVCEHVLISSIWNENHVMVRLLNRWLTQFVSFYNEWFTTMRELMENDTLVLNHMNVELD